MGLQDFVNTAAPALSAAEEIYLQSLIELTRSQLGEQPCVLFTTLFRSSHSLLREQPLWPCNPHHEGPAMPASSCACDATGVDLNNMRPEGMLQLLLNPSEQARELQGALTAVSGVPGNVEVSQAPLLKYI